MANRFHFFNRFRALFDRDCKARVHERNAMKQILKKLNRKKRMVLASLASAESPERIADLTRELHVIAAQRKKGISIVKSLKNGK